MQVQQRNKPYPGLFLTIEGGEGAGKSTFAEKLVPFLQDKGYEVVKTREPGGTKLSEAIRSLVLDPASSVTIGKRAELLLFLAARAQHLEEVILPALRSGKVVVCERFHDSTIAYQGNAHHLGMAHVETLCQHAFEHLEPDCTFFLDLLPEEGIKRITSQRKAPLDKMEQTDIHFHHEVRQGFLHLADQYPKRIVILDALQSPEKVFKDALVHLDQFLKPSLKDG